MKTNCEEPDIDSYLSTSSKSRSPYNERIDVEDLIKDFKIFKIESFNAYLTSLWEDLIKRSENRFIGIDKLTFSNFFQLPGIIIERLFSVFDKHCDGYLDLDEFLEGMLTLFTETYENLLQLIFKLYDFDRDGYIIKEDIRIILSYVPINSEKMDCNFRQKFEKEEFKDRVESQDELHDLLEKCFKNIKWIDEFSFRFVVENISSDIFLFPLIFILSRRPFSLKSLDEFDKQNRKFNFIQKNTKTPNPRMSNYMKCTKKFMIPSPNIFSKFSPSLTIRRTPFWHARTLVNNKNQSDGSNSVFSKPFFENNQHAHKHKDFLNKLGLNKSKEKDAINILTKYSKPAGGIRKDSEVDKNSHFNSSGSFSNKKSIDSGIQQAESNSDKLTNLPFIDTYNSNNSKDNWKSLNEGDSAYLDENVSIKEIPIFKKHYNNLVVFENRKITNSNAKDYSELPLLPSIKYTVTQIPSLINNLNKKKIFPVVENINDKIDPKFNFCAYEDDSDEDSEEVLYEGYLFKLSQEQELKKRYFKLIHKDLYCYKAKEDDKHKSMNNLSGAFCREGIPVDFLGHSFLSIQIINNNKTKFLYIDSSEIDEYNKWLKYLKKVTGYSDLNNTYIIGHKLGNGKFGIVRLGVHRTTQRKVAIKIMNKCDMSFNDVQMVKTEIEILKICQHPYIIRLYEVYENELYIYIVMEYCPGGDLYAYIESRNFRISEQQTASIIHKLSTALFYIHSYGIVHRDLKPENILMTDNTENSDIRIVDFGLSKIIGPNELCTEPYGTLSYVAPEILQERPYTKAVDLWSIGIIAYLLLTGCLPFDDDNSEREIARKTINETLPFPYYLWKDKSKEAKEFISNLLDKDPCRRMDVKQVLEHPWIQKCNKTILPHIRRKCKDLQQSTFKIYSTTDYNDQH